MSPYGDMTELNFAELPLATEHSAIDHEKSRGDCPSFEPLVAAYLDAALSPMADNTAASMVLKVSA